MMGKVTGAVQSHLGTRSDTVLIKVGAMRDRERRHMECSMTSPIVEKRFAFSFSTGANRSHGTVELKGKLEGKGGIVHMFNHDDLDWIGDWSHHAKHD